MEIFDKGISEKELSRRQLLTGAGKVAVGLTVASAGAITLACGADAKKQVDYPWPYKKLDPDKVAVRTPTRWQ
jgi:hypothetical protein